MSMPAETPTSSRGMWSKLLPEAGTAILLMLVATGAAATWLHLDVPLVIIAILLAEGAMLLTSWTLVDVATRLKAPPPWWLAIVFLAGALLAFPGAVQALQLAWQMGWLVFLPVAWSLLERMRELWTLPRASALEKYRRRALSAGRVMTGIFALVAFIVGTFAMWIVGTQTAFIAFDSPLPVWLLAAFYAIAAFDAWRVHRPAFARHPRQLWPVEHDDTTALSPL